MADPLGDEVEGRAAANAQRFGIALDAPTGAFSDRIDDAAIHAAESARADPVSATRPWYSLGPRNVGGRISAIAQDPLSPRSFYAGTAFGGLWKTEDGGDTWRPQSSFLETDANPGLADKDVAVPIGAIGICHRTPQTLYVGTGEVRGSSWTGTGLWMSTDGAQTFARIAQTNAGPIQALGYDRIEVDPWTPGRCWIGCHRGLFRRDPNIVGPVNIVQDLIDVADVPPLQIVTDIVIDFGSRAAAAPPGPFTIYVALRGSVAATPGGLFRAMFDPATNTYRRSIPANPASPIWTRLTDPALPLPTAAGQKFGRVKLALCEKSPLNICAVVAVAVGVPAISQPSIVFRSTDGGNTWNATAARPLERSEIAWYALAFAIHPEDPQIIFVGSTDIHRTVDGGQSWDKVFDFDLYEAGERAQHSDQHAFVFDRRDPRRVWSGNDGGISESGNLGLSWRKRSHGIVAAQFYDLVIHPQFPFIMGGGLQDNGSWLTYGGSSWYVCGRANGGGMAFQPGATDIFLGSHQGNVTRGEVQLTHLTTLRPSKPTFGWQGAGDLLGNWLADQPTGTDGTGATTYPYLVMNVQNFTPGMAAANVGTIDGRKLEGHPVRPDSFIAGEIGAGFSVGAGALAAIPPAVSTLTFTALATGPFAPVLVPTPAVAKVSAIAFAPTLPARAPSLNSDNNWWLGTTGGQVFFTSDGGATWVNATARLNAAGHGAAEITGFSVHPGNPSIVAVSTAALSNNVFLSADATTTAAGAASGTWRAISHIPPAPVGAAPRLDLPQGAIGRVLIDPQSPVLSDAANRQTIYAGTSAGVYVCRDATVAAAVSPTWTTFSAGMPLVLITDLDYAETYAADGTTVTRRVLRAGSFGRGIWECDLGVTPTPRLLLRSTTIDDGFTYLGAQTIAYDPRLNTPGQPAVPLDWTRAVDIRIDPPPYSFFGDVLDGVEFDEDLRSGTLVTGEINFIYVQVQNRGAAAVPEAVLHLYFADAAGAPAAAPPLDPTFWARFPNDPDAGFVWQRAGQVTVRDIRPDQPRVARVEWVPPTRLGGNVAVLAVISAVVDDLGPIKATLPVAVQPLVARTSLTQVERRTALYIAPARRSVPDVFVRDGIGDSGEAGAVAWGGRSADIVVAADIPPDPDASFGSIADERAGDRVNGGVDNHIFVRVFNRSAATQDATVDLFFAPMTTVADRTTWQQIGGRQPVLAIPAHGHRFSPVLTWAAADIPDPGPTSAIKAFVLIALIGTPDDPVPDPTGIATLSAFWDFFLANAGANNASFRGIRFIPA